MKVLHIWSTAGIGAMLANAMNQDCIARMNYDPFKISAYYGAKILPYGGKDFIDNAILRAEKYDVLHIHALYKIIPDIRRRYRGKKIVMHFHGSELSNCQDYDFLHRCANQADSVLVSTPDLLEYIDATHLPNPVDTDLFKQKKRGKGAFTIRPHYVTMEEMEKTVGEIEIVDRTHAPTEYKNMPYLFYQYGTYHDKKPYSWTDGKPVKAFSTTGLQALSCGLHVVDGEGNTHTELPDKHRLENVVDQLLKIYE